MDKIVIASSRWRSILSLVGALGFVAAGVLIVLLGRMPLAGWLSIVFFGGCALVFVWQVVDQRPRIVINDKGILDRTLKVGVIEWSDIRGAWVKRLNGVPFLCLELREPAKYIDRLSPMHRRLVGLNQELGFAELSVNLVGTAVDPERLEELVLKKIAVRCGLPAG